MEAKKKAAATVVPVPVSRVAKQFDSIDDLLAGPWQPAQPLVIVRPPRPTQQVVLANDARDKWLYEQCCKGRTYRAIEADLRRIAPRKRWKIISGANSIKGAATRYAKRHGLPAIPRRQQGAFPPDKAPAKLRHRPHAQKHSLLRNFHFCASRQQSSR